MNKHYYYRVKYLNMKQHIFIINEKNLASSYGVGTYINEYIKCLRRFDLEIHLVTLFCDEELYNLYENEFVDYINIPTTILKNTKYYHQSVCAIIKLYYAKIEKPLFHLNFHQNIFFVKYIKDYFNDAIILYTIHYSCWSLQLNSDVNLFKSILSKYNSNGNLSELEHRVILEFEKEKELFNKVDRIICLSNETYEILKSEYLISPTKINLIPNGIEDSYTPLLGNQKNIIRKYFHIKKKEKIILFVGRLTALKGAYILLDSFKKISPYHTNYRLFIIGDGDFNLLLNQAEPYWDRITFTGKIDKEKLNQLYKIADIGIIPSYCEQCSYVCLEMMMNAIPCIVSDGIGLNSIFKNNINSIVAKIVDYQNPDSYILNLEKSILDMINNASKKDNISKKSRLTYLEKFTLDHMFENYKKLFLTFNIRVKEW